MTWSGWLVGALVIGGVGYLSLAGFVWANRQGIGSRPLVVMLISVKVWSLCYALELSSRTVEVAQWWSVLKYLGIVALPPALWSFVLAYTGRGGLSRRTLALLTIHPIVAMSLLFLPLFVDGVPDQFRMQVYDNPPDLLLGAPVPGAGTLLFWIHAGYVYLLMLAADLVLFARLTKIARPYRRQGALLIAASLLPFVGNMIYNAQLHEEMIDPTPFLFGITAIVLVWGFFRLRLLDLAPVARGIVIEQMADGVIVLDIYGRIVDVNAAGAELIGLPRGSLIGRAAVEIVPTLATVLARAEFEPRVGTVEAEVVIDPWQPDEHLPQALGELPRPRSRHRLRPMAAGPIAAESARHSAQADAVSLTRSADSAGSGGSASATSVAGSAGSAAGTGAVADVNSPREVAVSLTWVTDQVNRPIARLAVLRDVTERNRTEHQLRTLLDEQTRLSETLRQTLRPASLPQVQGLRLAARSVPSARGSGVGGDFYDVHPAGDGISAFVLGDVSGKGVHAAVVTSMARYTVRTLSAQGWSPREVLHQLNRALQSEDDPERFCTVVYGHVHPPASGRTGVRLVLALGGHPPPLLRRHDRSVHPVGQPGTVLGLLPTVEVHEVTIDLAAGDVLLAYTDGVTEARSGDEQFGEARLADVLAEIDLSFVPSGVEPIPSGQLADLAAEAVMRAVKLFSSERDDVALLVLAAI